MPCSKTVFFEALRADNRKFKTRGQTLRNRAGFASDLMGGLAASKLLGESQKTSDQIHPFLHFSEQSEDRLLGEGFA